MSATRTPARGAAQVDVEPEQLRPRRGRRAPGSAPRSPRAAQRRIVFPRGRRDFLLQLGILLGFALAYQVARGLADRGPAEALANARRVVHLERHLGVFLEPDLQRPVVQTGVLLLHAVNWTYWLSQLVVVALALLWIYFRHNQSYLGVRNTLIVTNTIGLMIYVALPTAPPRLVSGLGIADTISQTEVVGHRMILVKLAANPYAAMPSLHAADALIIGIALAAVTRPVLPKVAFLIWPAWVSFALVATGNHFVLDIAAGVLLAAVGTLMANLLVEARTTRPWLSLGTAHRRPRVRADPRRGP